MDCDLARMDSAVHGQGLERTGTIPFLSLELLANPEFRQGGVVPTYNHDCVTLESQMGLPICLHVAKSSEVFRWLTVDMYKCLEIRSGYLAPQVSGHTNKIGFKHRKLPPPGGKALYRLLEGAHAVSQSRNKAIHYGENPRDHVATINLELYNAQIQHPTLSRFGWTAR